jgi:predicted Fe-Mo cluster-binding NifX family protein
MKTAVIVPVSDKNGFNARIAEHFGRAPFYAVVPLYRMEKLKTSKHWKRGSTHLFRTMSVMNACICSTRRISSTP